MNIANLDRITKKTAAGLNEELHQSLEFSKSMRVFSSTGARFAKLSYIFAVERAFKPLKGCSDVELRKIYLHEKNKARHYGNDREQFYNFIHNKVSAAHHALETVFWSKKLNTIANSADDNLFLGVLLSAEGFPLRHVIFRKQPEQNLIQDILAGLKKIYDLNRITALICEDTYLGFPAGQLINQKAPGATPEVFLHRESTNWLGQKSFTTDRYFLLNYCHSKNEATPQIINLINEFADYLSHGAERFQSVLTDSSLSTSDILDITLISYLLYKMIDQTLKKYSLTPAGNRTKFLHQIPGQPQLHMKDNTIN